jgi:hypothetical protein
MINVFTPHHPDKYRNRRVGLSHSINSTDAIFAVIKELVDRELLLPEGVSLKDYRLRTAYEADWLLGAVNSPQSRLNSLIAVQSYHQSWQRFDYVWSNLNTGAVFYFLCDQCGRRVKYLYQPDGTLNYRCRVCHKVRYPAKTKSYQQSV